MKVAIETITPIRAAELLKKSEGQNFRTLRPANVSKFQRDMSEGRWPVNGDSVKINLEGVVTDGQHRLTACVQSGIPLKTVVFYSDEKGTNLITDAGASRTPAQWFGHAGEVNSTLLAGITSLVVKYENGLLDNLESTHQIRQSLSIPERDAVLEKYPEIRQFVEKASKFPNQQAPLGFLWWLFAKKYPQKTKEFFEQYQTNENINRSHPAWHLRKKLVDDRNKIKGMRYDQERVLGWGFYAVHAHVKNETIRALKEAKSITLK